MDRPVLLRIPWSHYCKKAEWGLTQAGIPYDTLDVGFRGMRQIERANPEEGTVPLMVADGRRILGSARILHWADQHRREGAVPLYPASHDAAVRRWEAWVDQEVGSVARREAYRAAYRDPWRFTQSPAIRTAAWLGHAQILSVMKFYKVRRYDGHDETAIPQIIARVSDRLRKNGTCFLFGDRPTAADLATAALMEPLTFAARSRGYDALPGWDDCSALVANIRPEKVSRVRRRWMRQRHWAWFEGLREKEGKGQAPPSS